MNLMIQFFIFCF